jgi:hypothetical protein
MFAVEFSLFAQVTSTLHGPLMAAIDVLIKLGGSCITDKTLFEVARPDGVRHAAELLQLAQSSLDSTSGEGAAGAPRPRRRPRIVVVHGAGCFGHPQARASGIKSGVATDAQRLGFAATRGACGLSLFFLFLFSNEVLWLVVVKSEPGERGLFLFLPHSFFFLSRVKTLVMAR